MILPDVNVLINAFRADAADHALCREWLNRVIGEDSHYGMSTQVLCGVIRIVTHPRIFVQPSRPAEAVRFCNALLGQPHCSTITPGERHWSLFQQMLSGGRARGNLVSDAWFAALAIEAGCEWITLDRDYGRFPGLRWRRPSVRPA